MNKKVVSTIASCGLAISLLLSGCSSNKSAGNEDEVSTPSNEATEADAVVVEDKVTQAWGPQDREMFTWDNPATFPTFNSMTDNPTLGHESNFVRVREADSSDKYLDDVTLETGKEYEIFIYYHNNGAANLGAAVMAQNVRVKSNFPTELKAGQAGEVKATISATNTTPMEVWDTAYLNAEEDLILSYVPNSAILHNNSTGEYATDGAILDSESLFGDGAKIAHFSGSADRPNEGWGFIPGCNEYAGYITFRIAMEKA